ncbi:hypothetical protein MT418_003050 [Batrachochytrium dendrobatidis]
MLRLPAVLPHLLKASATSGTLYTLGNIVDQGFVQPHFFPPKAKAVSQHSLIGDISMKQAVKFGMIGAVVHGPYFYTVFRALDRIFGYGRSIKTTVFKSLFTQVAFTPPFIALFLCMSAVMNNKDVWTTLKEKFIPINISSCLIWPFLGIINFRWIPPNRQLIFINVCGIGWNTYMSFASNAVVVSPQPRTSTNI